MIIAEYDFDKEKWQIVQTELNRFSFPLQLKQKNKDPKKLFGKDFCFSYNLILNNNVVQTEHWPKEGNIIKRTENSILAETKICNLQPEEIYTLSVSLTVWDVTFEKAVRIIIPKPEKPYESWQWNGSEYISPVPYPQDGEVYIWSEIDMQWVIRPGHIVRNT